MRSPGRTPRVSSISLWRPKPCLLREIQQQCRYAEFEDAMGRDRRPQPGRTATDIPAPGSGTVYPTKRSPQVEVADTLLGGGGQAVADSVVLQTEEERRDEALGRTFQCAQDRGSNVRLTSAELKSGSTYCYCHDGTDTSLPKTWFGHSVYSYGRADCLLRVARSRSAPNENSHQTSNESAPPCR